MITRDLYARKNIDNSKIEIETVMITVLRLNGKCFCFSSPRNSAVEALLWTSSNGKLVELCIKEFP